jgi:hypothetical protein
MIRDVVGHAQAKLAAAGYDGRGMRPSKPLEREERRLARAMRWIILSAATPGALLRCGGPIDAGHPRGSASSDASVDVGASTYLLGDGATPDVYVAWCDAGPPQPLDASQCAYISQVPCGLPPGVMPRPNNQFGFVDCLKLCTLEAGLVPWECDLLDGSDEAGSAYVGCDLCTTGRRPAGLRTPAPVFARTRLGAYLARMAHLEAASVLAFERLARQLDRLGAPSSLVRAAERSAADEVRHARVASRLAGTRGGRVPEPRVARAGARSLEGVARENAVEGCVRETYGALLAAWQASHARDPGIARAMRRIARDERRHAALAWLLARWAEPQLGAKARSRVARAKQHEVRALRAEQSVSPPAELVCAAGLPTRDQAMALLKATATAFWS